MFMSMLGRNTNACIGYVAPIRRWRSNTAMGLCSGRSGELICLAIDFACREIVDSKKVLCVV